MSLRTAIAKLSICAAGGALIGGGAVHVAESPATAHPQYIKHEKRVAVKQPHHATRLVMHTEPRRIKRVRRIVKRTMCCEQGPQMAMVPMPAPMMPSAPDAQRRF